MSRLRQAPLTIKLYVAGFFLLVWAPVPFDHGPAPLGTFVGAFLITLVPFAFLLRGSRVAWALLLLVEIAALVVNLLAGPHWLVPAEAVFIALLLAPSSRAYTWGPGRPAT